MSNKSGKWRRLTFGEKAQFVPYNREHAYKYCKTDPQHQCCQQRAPAATGQRLKVELWWRWFIGQVARDLARMNHCTTSTKGHKPARNHRHA